MTVRDLTGEYSSDDDDQLQPEDTLIDTGVDDVLDVGYSPPDRSYSRAAVSGMETLDQRLDAEEPDPSSRIDSPLDTGDQERSDEAEREVEFPQRDEVGGVRAGRLVASNRGYGEDAEADLVAYDVGINGGAASAEEAAVHVIEDEG
ncbi:hypothetical protein M2272_000609 [Mycobacterium frederiksbergense]|uniref:DUF5709 domain-containing protein n=1 Tax=Mycolicibacterium frederiksbergense TaxID=117567 RepID=A0ABT6KTC5_9MYCO|nr:DUF5709 domain-containing protein [Mycolicibacterium frederiksbergense]MDH6193988.1 hypothetical protein [Mycolicibacterium frederiksbergense]